MILLFCSRAYTQGTPHPVMKIFLTSKLIATLFSIAKNCNQPSCPPTDEWHLLKQCKLSLEPCNSQEKELYIESCQRL